MIALGAYGGGLAIALVTGTQDSFVSSSAFAIGAIGTAWVFSSIPAKARRVDYTYSDAILAVDEPVDLLVAKLNEVFDRACDWRRHLVTSSVVFLLLAGAAWLAFFGFPVSMFGVTFSSLRPGLFQSHVYADAGGIPGFLQVLWFGALIALALGSAGWLVFAEFRALRLLASRRAVPLPEAVRSKLRGLADFHVEIARDWSIGGLLFVLLFAGSFDLGSIAFVTAILAAAFVMLVAPQVHIRRMILTSHRIATNITLQAWRERQHEKPSLSSQADALAVFSDAAKPPSYWVYGSGQVAMWVVAQLTALVALAFQIGEVFK